VARNKEEGRELVRRLVDSYRANRDYYRSDEFDETSTRTVFVDKLFEALGWDVTDPSPNRDVVFHARHQVAGSAAGDEAWDTDLTEEELDARGGHTDVPDYGFHTAGQLRFFVEAKRPKVGVSGRAAVFQVKSYAWNRSLPFSVLTDFENLRVYQATTRPVRERPNDGLLPAYDLSFDQYVEKWDRIWKLLSREQVVAGASAEYAEQLSPRGGLAVDEAFLRDMEEWRQQLGNDLLRRHPDLEMWQLEEATQRILDRLVFTRVVEDRDIEPKVVLRRYARLTDSYRHLRGEFRRLDAFYNGQLFAPHFSERLEVSDGVIQNIIASLYPLDGSPYRFDTFHADFLGKVYERFLGKQFERAGNRVRLVDKPEVRHAGGVYYTPRWVVDDMVATALHPLVDGRSAQQVARLRIVDPACGSGTFLLGVLDYLIRWYQRYYEANPSVDTENHYVDAQGRRQLTTDFKSKILVNNIFGVDVDPRAVEVSQMSLYLRILEEESAATISVQTRLFEGAHLPSLARNIRAGNSLISESDVPVALLADLDLRRRINPFDWRDTNTGFGSVFAEGGFDVVLGNPPYTRVQELRRSRPEETQIVEHHYRAAVAGFDIASLFTERGLSLIRKPAGRRPGGTVKFITSRTFTETNAGSGIRRVLATGSHVRSVIDFGAGQVFGKASVYTIILTATDRRNSSWELTRVPAPPSIEALIAAREDSVLHADNMQPSKLPANDSWPLALPAEDALLARLGAAFPSLGTVTGGVIFQGVVTGCDGVFRAIDLGPDRRKPGNRLVRPSIADASSPALSFESGMLRPVYAGRTDLRPFWNANSGEWLIMPYTPPNPGDNFMLLPWRTIERKAPGVAAWLAQNEANLRDRAGVWTDQNWYAYSRRQNLERFSGSKVMVPSMIDQLCATYDTEGHFFVNVSTGGYGLGHDVGSGTTPEYLAALMNSSLLSWVLQRYSRVWRGGWFEARKGNLQRLPIAVPAPEREDEIIRQYHDVRAAVAAAAVSPDDQRLMLVAETARRAYNHAIYALYGLTISEIALIESA
jgi:hypothetical protein